MSRLDGSFVACCLVMSHDVPDGAHNDEGPKVDAHAALATLNIRQSTAFWLSDVLPVDYIARARIRTDCNEAGHADD